MNDFAVSATYTHRTLNHIQYRVPIGSSAEAYYLAGNAAGQAVADNGFVLDFNEPVYGLDVPETPGGDLFLNRPGAKQIYNGVEFSAVSNGSRTTGWL